jgi:predicted dehydrogenase
LTGSWLQPPTICLHAVIAKAAMDLGKHVFVQKPLVATVHEARVLRARALASSKYLAYPHITCHHGTAMIFSSNQ